MLTSIHETAWLNSLLTSASINQTGWIYAFTHFRPGCAELATFGCGLWDICLLTMPWNMSWDFYCKDRSAFSPRCDTDAPQRGQYFQHQFLFLMKAGSRWWKTWEETFSLPRSVCDHLRETFQRVAFPPASTVTPHFFLSASLNVSH